MQLAVTPKEGRAALGVGQTKLYELINAGELATFKVGRATRITVTSIEAFIARQLAANASPQASKAA